jgi:hypothetical protein
MQWITTDAYKTLISRVLLGEALTLTPTTLVVGDGGHDPVSKQAIPPSSSDTALVHQTASVALQYATRNGYTLNLLGLLPGSGTGQNLSEVGVTTANGTLILRGTFNVQALQAGIDAQFSFDLFPEA